MKKIRILHCVTAMNRGGLETLIMNFYRNIDREKFEFDFLVQRDGQFDFTDEIEKLGGKIYHVKKFNPLYIREYNKSIDDFFKKHHSEYDIVHAHNNSFAMYVLRAAKKYGISVRISHSHIAKNTLSLKYPFVLYNKLLLKKYCNVEYACGEDAGKFLFNNNDFKVIKNAIDLTNFKYSEEKRKEIRKKLELDNNTIIIGHVGRFELQKNHQFIVELAKKLLEKNFKFKFLLLGTGSLKKEIEKQVYNNNLEKNVIFAGNISNVYDYLNAMDMFILPSLFEGLPVTLIEAQANGLTCLVSTNVAEESKITELVKFKSLNDSINDWCDEIIELSSNKRKNVMKQIEEAGYEIKISTKILENNYIELLKKYSTFDN